MKKGSITKLLKFPTSFRLSPFSGKYFLKMVEYFCTMFYNMVDSDTR